MMETAAHDDTDNSVPLPPTTTKKESFLTEGTTEHTLSDDEEKESIIVPSNEGEEEPTSTTTSSDEEIISAANVDIHEECLLAAARLLRRVQDKTKLTDQHRQVLLVAQDMKESSDDLLQDPDSSWTKQSEFKSDGSSGKNKKKQQQRDTTIYYKLDGPRLESRVDCVMESSLLVPLLSVLNETDLYATWIPSWTSPIAMGINESKQLKQVTRTQQIIHITCNVPWPISTRDVILRATAADDIAAHHAIIVRMKGVEVAEDPVVPEPLPSVVRCAFEGAILFRPCPKSKLPKESGGEDSADKESKLMVSLKMFVDPRLSIMPTSMINFVTRTVIGTMWNMMLQVAEGVRDGKRPLHMEAIRKRKELYDWIRERINVLLGKLGQEANTTISATVSSAPKEAKESPNEEGNRGFVALVQS